MIAIDSSKQQACNADPKAIQQINFIGNQDQARNAAAFLVIEEAKRNYFRVFARTVTLLISYIILTKMYIFCT